MTKRKMTIMIIEDEELLMQAILHKLTTCGMETVSCLSSQQALDYLESAATTRPDAIWLDFYLKDTNGLTFMKTVKKHQDWRDIPVVVVSNSASPDKVHTMLALGARKYILKADYRLDEIVEILRGYITPPKSANKHS